MGKGSTPRPMEIDREQFGNRFDAIFGKRMAVCDTCGDKRCPRATGDQECNNAQPTRDLVGNQKGQHG